MKLVSERNVSLFTDLYELTMADAYLRGRKTGRAVFELFVRNLPGNRGYLVACGIYDALEYSVGLKFGKEEISYLESTGKFGKEFLDYLEGFRFSGDIFAFPEGTPVFSMEPILRVEAPLIEAQILETFLINCVGFQTMVATKASRVCHAAHGKPVVDFGLRRSQGADAGLKSARAAYIGGCSATSNVLAGKEYGIPVAGTVAHSFVLAHENELEAFRAVGKAYEEGCVFLIDTYGILQGAKNAALVAKEMEKQGKKAGAVRIDSGDLFLAAGRVRKILDDAGLGYIKIFASGGLDEYKIRKLASAPIESFGVGTAMDVSDDAPFLDINYKLCEYGGRPARKTSEGKVTLPGRKQVYRFVEKGEYAKDLIALEGEKVSGGKPILLKMVEKGKAVFSIPSIQKIRENCLSELGKLPTGVKRIEGPGKYAVGISKKLEMG